MRMIKINQFYFTQPKKFIQNKFKYKNLGND